MYLILLGSLLPQKKHWWLCCCRACLLTRSCCKDDFQRRLPDAPLRAAHLMHSAQVGGAHKGRGFAGVESALAYAFVHGPQARGWTGATDATCARVSCPPAMEASGL
jgi:hypothetical protein